MLFIVIMANSYRNADLLLAISRPLVLHKCNIWIYFLLLLTQVDFFRTTFYFLESRKFSHYFYFLKSRIFGMYFYFLESSKVIYFWQHWIVGLLVTTIFESTALIRRIRVFLYLGFSVFLLKQSWLIFKSQWQHCLPRCDESSKL